MTGKLFAYHLKSPRVPLVVRVPQFENHCFRGNRFSGRLENLAASIQKATEPQPKTLEIKVLHKKCW